MNNLEENVCFSNESFVEKTQKKHSTIAVQVYAEQKRKKNALICSDSLWMYQFECIALVGIEQNNWP